MYSGKNFIIVLSLNTRTYIDFTYKQNTKLETMLASMNITRQFDPSTYMVQSPPKVLDAFRIYENMLVFFKFNFKKLKSLDDDGLQNKYLNLESFLKRDIDGLDLFSVLKVLE
jgi:hypothetical protein